MTQWYTFTIIAGASPIDPTNYSNPVPNKPSCPGSKKICAILSNDDGQGHPSDIDCLLINEMAYALQNGIDTTGVALRT